MSRVDTMEDTAIDTIETLTLLSRETEVTGTIIAEHTSAAAEYWFLLLSSFWFFNLYETNSFSE